jgi:hypothetical protein
MMVSRLIPPSDLRRKPEINIIKIPKIITPKFSFFSLIA